MADTKRDQERAELHKSIWGIADALRGSVDGWDFKAYVLGTLFYRYISENLRDYINKGEREMNPDFDYANLSDEDAEDARQGLAEEKGFFILPSELFSNVVKKANKDNLDLNEKIAKAFKNIEKSSQGTRSEKDFKGLFDDFADKYLLSDMQMQDYQSHYADLYDKWRRHDPKDKVNINDDVVFEIELIKQMEVNIDYILNLIAESKGKFDGEIIAHIRSAMSSSFQLRSMAKLIEDFVNNLAGDDVNGQWKNYIEKQIVDDLDQIIDEEHLKSEETYKFVSFMLDNQRFDTSGVMVASVLPPVSRFGGKREAVKDRVIARLNEFFDRYWDLGINLPKA